ncbi:MAG: 16S rRNA (guanine(966)-N(2))-methyltransferase RsmD [Coriobacteriia bacterium]|nr:16S rRNA (guanine(966)-N(2))-methyltransferase RsmD [Coriobacteriia bacterium]
MRVIAGTHRGRRIQAPAGTGTRPTSDRVREALFSRIEAILGEIPQDMSGLDLFAGSGALGIEALSRGLSRVTFVERDRCALRVLRRNLDSLGLAARATVLQGDAIRLATGAPLPGAPFALLFLDPPYRINKSEVSEAVEHLASTGSLGGGALLVWEHGSSDPPKWPCGFESLGERRYGDTTVSMSRMEGGETG